MSTTLLQFLGQRRAAWLLAPTLLLAAACAQAEQLRLRLLQTTDLHMNLVNYDYYQDKVTDEFGLAKTATLIKAARAENANTLLFDNGDLLQGSPLGDFVATSWRTADGQVKPPPAGYVHPAYRVMSYLGYDAANIGNHEFNYGLPYLRQALGTSPFPLLNANVFADGKHAFTPYVILERRLRGASGKEHTLKVGVMGLVPPQIMQWDQQHLQGRVTVRDIAETATRLVPELKQRGADVVVLIAHSGFERGETVFFGENAVAKLAEIPGVDAILFGHSHGEFPGRFFSNHPKVNLERGTINGVPAVMPGRWGDHLGVVDLLLDDTSGSWKVSDARAELRPIWDRQARKALVEADPEVARLVAAEHEGTLRTMRAEIATTRVPIFSFFAQVADDPSVQLVSQAQIAYARKALAGTPHAALPVLSAAAPFKTGGRQGWGYYTDIPAGPVALRNVADLYIYPNTLKGVKLNGAQVREWLEMSAGAFNTIVPADKGGAPEQNLLNSAFPSFNFDTIDGVSYRIDVSQPPRYDRNGKVVAADARRIVDLRFNGAPIDEKAEFIVVTNNYRASGGGNFPALDGSRTVLDAPDENREALVQYMREAKTLNPAADGNWRVQPVAGVKLRFASSAAAIKHLERYPQIKLVRDNGDGSALYELAP